MRATLSHRYSSSAIAALIVVAAAPILAACGGAETPSPTAVTATPTATATAVPTQTSTAIRAPTPRPITLPGDEAPHSDPVEWWYYSGVMRDEAGARYGFHFVIFQVKDGQTGGTAYMSHASVTDIGRDTHEQASRFALGAQGQPASGFALTVSDWALIGENGRHAFSAETDSYALDLNVSAAKPAARHNRNGYLIGLGGWTYYYSWTRMDVTGTLTTDGHERAVTGEAWMDHQWGDFEILGYPTGWQWFAVQMENGHEVMVAESREESGETIVYATLVDPAGGTTHVDGDAISLDVLGEWTSPHTGGVYPAGWRIAIPEQELSMTLTPVQDDQEITLAFPRHTIYWEGLVDTEITFNGEPVSGSGYVELVGYVPPLPSPTPAAG